MYLWAFPTEYDDFLKYLLVKKSTHYDSKINISRNVDRWRKIQWILFYINWNFFFHFKFVFKNSCIDEFYWMRWKNDHFLWFLFFFKYNYKALCNILNFFRDIFPLKKNGVKSLFKDFKIYLCSAFFSRKFLMLKKFMKNWDILWIIEPYMS